MSPVGPEDVASGVFPLHDCIPCSCLNVAQLWELASFVQGLIVLTHSCSCLLSSLWIIGKHSQGVDTWRAWYKGKKVSKLPHYKGFGMDYYSLLLCLLAGVEQLRHCTCLQTLDIS